MSNRLNKDVGPGQIWLDCDPRAEGRAVKITSTAGLYAYGVVVADAYGARRPSMGRKVRIRLDQFWPTSRGFRRASGSG